MLRDVKVTIEAATEEELALLLVEDDEAMLALVLGPSDGALPIVVNVEVLLLVCCGSVLTNEAVDTADVTLVVDDLETADVVEAVEDVQVDVLTVMLGLLEALITDTAELDC